MDDELMTVPVPLDSEPTSSLGGDEHHEKKVKLSDVNEKSEHGEHGASNSGGAVGSTGGRRRGGRVGRKGEPTMMLPSFIWDYFVKDTTGKFVICTLCPDQTTRFAYSGGTSTMNRHLRKKHQKYAPGKSAADYEYPKASKRSNSSPHSSANHGDGNLSPSEAQKRQLIDLRNSRRRAANKRRKVHPGLLDATGAEHASTYPASADFDPSGFVNLPGQFGQGFDLNDGSMDMAVSAGVDSHLLGYGLSAAASSAATGTSGAVVGALGLRSRRSNAKILTHRLLKYLIAQYEPLDVSRMGPELNVLLYGTDYQIAAGMSGGIGIGSGIGSGTGTGSGGGGSGGGGGIGGIGGNGNMNNKLPSEETLKLALANLYYSQREILKEVIAEVEVLSLSLNNWKSVFGQNVLTVSGHWISNGFNRRDCVLEVYVLPLDETVNTIALLRDVMDKWDIPVSKVSALTMIQNGKEEAIHEEFPSLTLVNCFVHTLDVAVTLGLEKFAPLIRRCRNYVSYFIQNPSEYQIFLSLQKKFAETTQNNTKEKEKTTAETTTTSTSTSTTSSTTSSTTTSTTSSTSTSTCTLMASSSPPPLSVICDFEDRWNSTSEMICRLVELEEMLVLYKSNLENDTNPIRRPMQLRFTCCELTNDEWLNLKEMARLLEPIESVLHVSNVDYPSISIIYPLIHSIKKHLENAQLWITMPLVSDMSHIIANTFSNNFFCTAGTNASSPYLACLLDPRFKTLSFLENDERTRIMEMLKLLHTELINEKVKTILTTSEHSSTKKQRHIGSTGTILQQKKGGLLTEFFPIEAIACEGDVLKHKVDQYLESPSLPATDDPENDPLEWWNRYQRAFPLLAKIAKKYLCISASSLPFYEAFTNYGQLVKEKKARLDIEVAAQILFCRSVSRIPEMERMSV